MDFLIASSIALSSLSAIIKINKLKNNITETINQLKDIPTYTPTGIIRELKEQSDIIRYKFKKEDNIIKGNVFI